MSIGNRIGALSPAVSIGAMSAQAWAESFNRRGIPWISATPAGTYAPQPPVQATVQFFNNRGILWASAASAGTYAVTTPVAAKSEGWIRRQAVPARTPPVTRTRSAGLSRPIPPPRIALGR